MRTLRGYSGDVPQRLGLKLDPDDLRILSALYFRGVCPARALRESLGFSRLTFHLRVRRLKRAGIIAGASDAIDIELHNLNLTVSARGKLFGLEMEIRGSGLFGGQLAGEGTGTRAERLSFWNLTDSAQFDGEGHGEWARNGSIE